MKPSSRDSIEQFLQHNRFAVFGVSRHQHGFGWMVFKEMIEHGHIVYPVNRNSGNFNGYEYHGSLATIPEPIKAVILITPAEGNAVLVENLINQGVEAVWMQPGAVSEAAVQLCHEHGVTVVHGWCILMFLEPVRSFHWLHRKACEIVGKVPG